MEDLPNQGFCPMIEKNEVLEKAREVYTQPMTRVTSQESARVEATGYCEWTRVRETMEFAERMGVNRIGLAYCIGLKREATTLTKIFTENGFEVISVCCKTGSIPKEEIGLKDDEKVRPGTYESLCNPIGQAMIMNEEQTGLNVIVGLCVGHDSLFIKHSEALVTCLIAKDRVLAHNPVGAIYTAQSYYNKKLYERKVS